MLRNHLQAIRRQIDTIDEFAIDTLSRLTTWLAPLVPAIMVYHSAQVHIPGVDEWQAFVMAAVIELLGLSVVSNWLNVAEFNRQFAEERIGVLGHLLMVVAYVATVLLIVVGLKVEPITFGWLAIIMLSMLSLWSAVAFVQRRQHSERMAEKLSAIEVAERDKEFDRQLRQAQRLAEHERKLAAIRDTVSRDMSHVTGRDMSRDMSKTLSQADRHTALLSALQAGDATIDYEAMASLLGVSARTVRRDVTALEAAGRIHVNGKVEVRG